MRAEQELQKTFNFRTWQKDEKGFEYCGASLQRYEDGTWIFDHKQYLQKIKPVTLEKGREPHSQLSGAVSVAWVTSVAGRPVLTTSSGVHIPSSERTNAFADGYSVIMETNKLLKFAQDKSDVC